MHDCFIDGQIDYHSFPRLSSALLLSFRASRLTRGKKTTAKIEQSSDVKKSQTQTQTELIGREQLSRQSFAPSMRTLLARRARTPGEKKKSIYRERGECKSLSKHARTHHTEAVPFKPNIQGKTRL
jgi:hypothetical protein